MTLSHKDPRHYIDEAYRQLTAGNLDCLLVIVLGLSKHGHSSSRSWIKWKKPHSRSVKSVTKGNTTSSPKKHLPPK